MTEAIRLIDCDIHPSFQNGFRELAPYLTEGWRVRFGMTSAPATDVFGRSIDTAVEMPRSPLYVAPSPFRRDAIPPDGGLPASDPGFVAAHHLDPNKIDRALLLGGSILPLGAFADPERATAVASAYNDWLEATWIEADPRFRGTITVAPQDPEGAAREIRRCAERCDRWVGVLLPVTRSLMGDLVYHPIYREAEHFGLPICVHIGGVEGTFTSSPALPGGPPVTYFEYKTTYTTVYQANLASLVIRGIFGRFPGLRVAFIECGIGWLPELLWRMDANWKALRVEAPWLKRPPSEYVFDHVRFASQPFVEPPTAKQLRNFCEMIQVERTLMFASDYPHYDYDDPKRTLTQIPADARASVAAGNALELFGERMRSMPHPAAAGA
jgi:predicted TIM-barrel fold metal-dependent hydrolase